MEQQHAGGAATDGPRVQRPVVHDARSGRPGHAAPDSPGANLLQPNPVGSEERRPGHRPPAAPALRPLFTASGCRSRAIFSQPEAMVVVVAPAAPPASGSLLRPLRFTTWNKPGSPRAWRAGTHCYLCRQWQR